MNGYINSRHELCNVKYALRLQDSVPPTHGQNSHE